jgi:hypothetical protein
LALASLTGGDRSIGIVRLRTKTTEFSLVLETSLKTAGLKAWPLVAALNHHKRFFFGFVRQIYLIPNIFSKEHILFPRV